MNIMKFFAIALTVSMLGNAVAFADTVATPQAPNSSTVTKKSLVPTETTNMADEGNVPAQHVQSQPLAFADFGQKDESGTEN